MLHVQRWHPPVRSLESTWHPGTPEGGLSGLSARDEPFVADQLKGVRTGRANVGLVDSIRVDYYGSSTPLKQMARRTGLSVSLLSQIERAESSASISSLYKIAVALESRIQDLFGQY